MIKFNCLITRDILIKPLILALKSLIKTFLNTLGFLLVTRY